MSCFYPLQAFQSLRPKSNGKHIIYFQEPRYSLTKEIQLPCGKCSGCRLERSRQWAVRCEKEIQSHDHRGLPSCFITLTFNDESLAKRDNPLSLDKRDFQLFMKRLRKKFATKIKYYHCGEYGDLYKRPHYHAIIFGIDFSDKKLWKVVNGQRLYTSAMLSTLWPFGFSSIGTATFESAAYVARYIMKKHLGKNAWLHYADIDFETGEIRGQRIPEYTTMSRRSGIGKEWLDLYFADIYRSDGTEGGVFIRGKNIKCKPPRYFDSHFEIKYPSDFSRIKSARSLEAKKRSSDNTPERLLVKEKVLQSKLKLLKRNLE